MVIRKIVWDMVKGKIEGGGQPIKQRQQKQNMKTHIKVTVSNHIQLINMKIES